jgi:hypothetical protein
MSFNDLRLHAKGSHYDWNARVRTDYWRRGLEKTLGAMLGAMLGARL